MRKKIFIFTTLSVIIFIAIVTRFYLLGKSPAGLYIDEAGQGYSAYSIWLTGRDEFGMLYPAVFRSFTDFKTPVYVYLIVPLIQFFGLTPFTVRFPSFIFSIFTFPILFLLLEEILPRKIATTISLVTVFLLSISPWHILFGRTNFECNVALFFLISGIYTFYLGLKKPFWITVSALLFAIAVPSYHSQRIVTPAIVLLLTFRYYKIIFDKSHLRWTLAGILISLLISIPTLLVALTPGFLARASGLNIFSPLRVPQGFIEGYQGGLGQIVNSRLLLSTQEFFSLYFSYFSPRYMFNLGDYGPRSSYPELATYFVWQFPFYIYGLYILFIKKLGELKFLTIALLLISPIPAALTRDPYSTIRALPLVIPQTIIISLGFIYIVREIYRRLPKVQQKYAFIVIGITTVVVTLYSIGKLYSSAFILNEYYRAREWDWGWQEVAEIIKQEKVLPIIVDNSRDEPYIELAFFLKYPPELYQSKNHQVTKENYYTNMNHNKDIVMGNIATRNINWEKDLQIEQILIGDELSISTGQINEHNLQLIREIKYPDKSVAFRIVKTSPGVAK